MLRASSSLEEKVHRSGRSVRQTTTYNSTTGKAANNNAVQSDYACLAGLHNEEMRKNIKVKNFYLKIKSGRASLGGGFTNTDEFRVIKYKENPASRFTQARSSSARASPRPPLLAGNRCPHVVRGGPN